MNNNSNGQQSFVDKITETFRTYDEQFDPNDIESNKVVSAISYLWILFFLPLIASPNSKYGRHNANQALLLFIVSAATSAVLGVASAILAFILPFIAVLFQLLVGLVTFAFTLVMVICLVVTFKGGTVKLPLIGHIKIIK